MARKLFDLSTGLSTYKVFYYVLTVHLAGKNCYSGLGRLEPGDSCRANPSQHANPDYNKKGWITTDETLLHMNWKIQFKKSACYNKKGNDHYL